MDNNNKSIKPSSRENNLCLAIESLNDENPYQFFLLFSEDELTALSLDYNPPNNKDQHRFFEDIKGSPRISNWTNLIKENKLTTDIIYNTISNLSVKMARCLNIPEEILEFKIIKRYKDIVAIIFHKDQQAGEDGIRISVPFIGKSTIFIPFNNEAYSKFNAYQNKSITKEQLDSVYNSIAQNKAYETAAPGEAVTFRAGFKNGALHSAPEMHKEENRLTIIITCNDECLSIAQTNINLLGVAADPITND